MEPRPYGGGGGVGGKIRRRQAPRAAGTPYDRPPAAAAAHRLAAAAAAAAGGGGGWLSRFVDPASRLIAGGAARFFSSVFRKRLEPPPPPSPPGGNTQSGQDMPESTDMVSTPPVSDRGTEEGKSLASTSDDMDFSEVKHLLMQKKFTRLEFDRLTELLRSRTLESDLLTPGEGKEKNEVNTSARRDRMGGSMSHGIAWNDSTIAGISIDRVSSPTEVGKKYMTSRSRGHPSSISLRSNAFLVDQAEPSSVAYATKRSGAPLVPKSTGHADDNPELSENGSLLRGRAALYRVARRPLKSPSSSSDMNAAPLTFSQRLARNAQYFDTGGRQALKRRSADLHNEDGSIGPTRRIRQKSSVMSPMKDPHAGSQGNILPGISSQGLDIIEGSSSAQELSSWTKHWASSPQFQRRIESQKNVGDGKCQNDVLPPVPTRSKKMAEKIFEQLDTIVPSPKEKQPETKSAVGDDMHSVLEPIPQDHGLHSTEVTTSSLNCRDLDGTRGSVDLNNDSLFDKKLKSKENALSKHPSLAVKFTSEDRNVDAAKSDRRDVHDEPPIFGNSASSVSAPSRKPGFRMVVSEDSMDVDDDHEAVDKVESRTTEQKFESGQRIESKIPEQKAGSMIPELGVITSTKTTERPVKGTLLSSLISSHESEKKTTSSVHANNSIGFTFPLVPSSNANNSVPPPTPSMPISPPAMSTKEEQATASAFTFGLKQSNTSTADGVKADKSVAHPNLLDSSYSNKGGDEREKADSLPKPSESAVSSAESTLAKSPTFASASTSSGLSNGLSHSPPLKFSLAAASDATPSDKPTIKSVTFSTMTTFATSSSSQPTSSAVPVFPTFSFGSSASKGTQMAPSENFDGANVDGKPASVVSFGTGSAIAEVMPSSAATSVSASVPSTTSSTMAGLQSPSAASFTFSSSGNGIVGFGAPAQSSCLSTSVASSASQASAAFGTSPGTLFGSKPAESGSGVLPLSQSSTTQLSSPFLSPSFGAETSSSGSGALTFVTGASSSGPGTSIFGAGTSSSSSALADSPFGSAAAFSKPFSPSSGSVFSFSSSSSAASASSSTIASASAFGGTPGPSSSSTVSNLFGPTSSQPSIFTFGQSASGSSFTFAAQPAPIFSSQPAPVYSFTPATTNLNLSTTQPAFGMGNANVGFGMGSPGNDQMNVEDSMADDTKQPAPATNVFGALQFGQPSSSPASSVFGAVPVQPGGTFQFGAHQGSVQQSPLSSFPAAGGLQGGAFSLGSGAGDGSKSGRRIIKVSRKGKKK